MQPKRGRIHENLIATGPIVEHHSKRALQTHYELVQALVRMFTPDLKRRYSCHDEKPLRNKRQVPFNLREGRHASQIDNLGNLHQRGAFHPQIRCRHARRFACRCGPRAST